MRLELDLRISVPLGWGEKGKKENEGWPPPSSSKILQKVYGFNTLGLPQWSVCIHSKFTDTCKYLLAFRIYRFIQPESRAKQLSHQCREAKRSGK